VTLFHGKDVAIIDGTTGDSRNYVELASDRDAIAAALQSMNFASDEMVGLLSPNHCDYYAAVAGTLRAGLPVTPMNPVYTSEEIATQLKGSNAKVLITHAGILDKVQEALKDAPSVKELFVVGDEDTAGVTSIRSLIKNTSTSPTELSISNDATAVLPYSSGTTGMR